MTSSAIPFPNLDPVLLDLGLVKIHWYGMMYLLAFGLAYWLANRAAAKPGSGWNSEQVSDLLFYGFVGVLLGGRVGYILFYNFATVLNDPLYLFRIWEGGMSFHGGLIGVLTAMALFARKYQKAYLALGDFVAPLVPLGLAAGRIGNFINGELWGRTTDVPWAMVFPGAGALGRHPSQLYQVALEGLLLFIVILIVRRLRPPVGVVGGVFLLGYGLARFTVEFFREPDAHLGLLSLGMTMGQWLCLPMMLAGIGIMVFSFKQGRASGVSSQ
ncbi:prolipoprotein diacylglyceryl transferase [Alishewanella sp. SMS8]|uniref:prolipoprotein diacylglyceryl transferase n=1 Tax=unclassified Alishewanella TaxID=2628974 RepID=UPI002741FC61|nr:prolipoprotein diacylglyceryl transferase [Alishewanella sp. SMS8]MDP4946115.1 prolipoprotein diacylglyceryl transferase [Alishewanella sp.]MDP5035560.1 prolipoprotein diacylglyceryl transferase [Alishewanella sp.]MDP5459838.1 prolipoprotein diacylglyceryl transferase [Alishewanella sp. SMS8]